MPSNKVTFCDQVDGSNPYRNIRFVPLVGDFAVEGYGAVHHSVPRAQHRATLEEAMTLRDQLEEQTRGLLLGTQEARRLRRKAA